MTAEKNASIVRRYAEKYLNEDALHILSKLWHVILLSRQKVDIREIENYLSGAHIALTRLNNDLK